ncbi:DUF1735 domain-containing protein [Mucilaginibacter myungsuensis]|uniref:DUF1735 domain-containing protein n=1 Tax=Mucilaginibacter myungsuensis TaxID=649104 RepID=A0A929PYD4_9SPHI|nr:DUF1735 domain-containing protein [Mucilaginibacter myungsuensis]MBE9664131.1 DUF1735 domain-containing protein [Mucilaginibacter myungsuensis]MDN3601310.1 DUF1735 domain-containing protein [Mucilaginibacter myungsuensis]
MKKFCLFLLSLAVVSLSSCLKDGKVNLAPGASPMVIQWATAGVGDLPLNSVNDPYRIYGRSYVRQPSIAMNLQVSLTGTDPASEDITVGIGLNNGAVTPTTASPLLPTNLYTMPTSVVILKGTRTATVPVVLNTNNFDVTKTYLLPVQITSTTQGGISGNYGTVIYQVQARNKYDGIYTVTGTFNDNTNAAFLGQYPITQDLRTVGATAVSEYDGRYFGNSYNHPFLNGTSQTSYGGWAPRFEMDANDNVIAVTNHFGQGNNSRSARLDATGVNKWTFNGTTPVKMEVTYWLVQGTADRTKFTETWTFQSLR